MAIFFSIESKTKITQRAITYDLRWAKYRYNSKCRFHISSYKSISHIEIVPFFHCFAFVFLSLLLLFSFLLRKVCFFVWSSNTYKIGYFQNLCLFFSLLHLFCLLSFSVIEKHTHNTIQSKMIRHNECIHC